MSLLRSGQAERVRVVVPSVTTLEAYVVRVVPGAAELCLVEGSSVPLRFVHRRPAAVTSHEGGEELRGMLLAVPDAAGRLRDDLVHFLQAVVPLRQPAPSPSQRRDFARVELDRPITMIPEGFQVGWLNGHIHNLSAGGLLVAGAGRLDLGRRMRLRFELADDEDLLDLSARIVRADDDWGLRGLRLERLDERTRDQLARFVHERQRRALAELRARAG
jgi:hypothetical protein